MRDIVSEIKARLSIEDVVSQYVKLQKAGRYYKALSPFQQEKTPSFVVSPEKQIAYCFSTHKGGDMFRFIQDIESVDFPEAVRILADKAGIKMPEKSLRGGGGVGGSGSGHGSNGEVNLREQLLSAHEKAARFYEENLWNGSGAGDNVGDDVGAGTGGDAASAAKKVLEYLKKRGVTTETIKEFRIGYAPDSYDALQKHLLKAGFNKDILIKSGLMTVKDMNGEVIDKFRCRLMIPIFDHMGRIIGFGGRALKEGQDPKYLNSPETPLYSKRKVLYGLSHSKQYIREQDAAVFVEGYFDVIMLYQAGIKNVVASSGTALTSEQVNLVKRFAHSFISCFDTDRAGIDATRRAYIVLQPFDMVMKTLRMGDGFKDPADFILENGLEKGKEEFEKFIADSVDFIEFYAEILGKNFDTATIDGRKKFLNEIIPLVKIVGSSVKLDYYVHIISKYVDTKEKFLYDEIEKFKLGPEYAEQREEKGVAGGGVAVSKKLSPVEILIGIVIEYPNLFPVLENSGFEAADFDAIKDIYFALKDQYNPVRTSKEGWNFDGEKYADIRSRIDVLSLYATSKYGDFSDETIENEVKKLIDNMKGHRRMHQRLQLEKALKEADAKGDIEKKKELLQLFQDLLTS